MAAAKKTARNAGGRMTKMRREYETANPQRNEGFAAQMPGARNMSPGQVSRAMGYGESEAASHGEQQPVHPLQGTLFQHPHMVDSPPRWEHMQPKQQARILSAAQSYGATPESMKKAYSSQLQRGLMRDPEHLSFYEASGKNEAGTDLPRERLQRSAQETGTPFHVVAATNAITSPQMSFVQRSKTGNVTYPNAETAEGAVSTARAGMTGEEYKKAYGKGTGKKYPFQGYPANLARAIDVTSAVEKGTPLREAWNPGGRAGAGAGDKVRAYHNAWIDPKSPEGNFLVSDTHTGGGGMAPHLAGTKHEQPYLSTAGIHSLHDYVARGVHQELGLGSVSRAQSLQWNQEKAERGGEGSTAESLHGAQSVEQMKPAQKEQKPRNVSPGQMRLF